MINAVFVDKSITTDNDDRMRELYDQSRIGEPLKDGRFRLSLLEALFLIDHKKLVVLNGRHKPIERDIFFKKARKADPDFGIRYAVFYNLRKRGYIVKTALKFGADFRVYDRGVKPGEDHAKWVVYPAHESEALTWYDFAAKNRVAHSTKKKLLIGVVDNEGDVSYWEVRWLRP